MQNLNIEIIIWFYLILTFLYSFSADFIMQMLRSLSKLRNYSRSINLTNAVLLLEINSFGAMGLTSSGEERSNPLHRKDHSYTAATICITTYNVCGNLDHLTLRTNNCTLVHTTKSQKFEVHNKSWQTCVSI